MKLLKLITGILLLATCATNAQMKQTLNLLPVPKEIQIQEGSFAIDAELTIAVKTSTPDTILLKAVNRAYQSLSRKTGLYFPKEYIRINDTNSNATILVRCRRTELPAIGNDESYKLTVGRTQILIDANTTAGALHGLQTLLQLVERNGNKFTLPLVNIDDVPRFAWRGFMIDVSRHFMPMDVIKRNMEAMEAVKMNVLHLHLTDDQGFRIESKVYPDLHKKGSNGDYYTQTQIKELITFAQERGIVIIPEFDMPGHSKSWFAGYPQLSSSPGPFEPGAPINFESINARDLPSIMNLVRTAPFPAIDPSKESTYTFLDKFLGEMAALFPSPYIHIGADEVNGVVWKNNPAIVAFMEKNKIADVHALQAYFVNRVHKIVSKYKKQVVGWEELFSKELPKDVTVQVWQNPAYIKNASQNGNPVILSLGFYLDIFMPAHVHYNNPNLPRESTNAGVNQVKGGEAAQWTEAADKFNVETRVWPRAGAIAERLWSPGSFTDVDDMYRRLFQLGRQLDVLGIRHRSAYENALRLYSNDESYASLKVLTDVLTPIKGYKKLFARMTVSPRLFYQSAPQIEISDIIPVDSETKWNFRNAVRSFLQNKDAASEKKIREWLNSWKDNHVQLEGFLIDIDQLKKIQEHSRNLSVVASIGLEAIEKFKTGGAPAPEWINDCQAKLKSASQAYGDTELAIVLEIEALVKQQLVPLPAVYPVF